jgi:hypothetical protein
MNKVCRDAQASPTGVEQSCQMRIKSVSPIRKFGICMADLDTLFRFKALIL